MLAILQPCLNTSMRAPCNSPSGLFLLSISTHPSYLTGSLGLVWTIFRSQVSRCPRDDNAEAEPGDPDSERGGQHTPAAPAPRQAHVALLTWPRHVVLGAQKVASDT